MATKKEYDYKRSTFYFNGKQYTARGKNQKEADKKAALKKNALENGEIGISKNMTVSAWCYEWLETFKKGKITDKSYACYKRHIDNLIVAEIGNVKLKEVRDVHLQKILNSRQGYSKSDTTKVRNTIQAIFKRARISRLIPYDPAEELEMPRTTQGKRRSITDKERAWILKTAETHHAGLWVKLMLYTGLRPGEAYVKQKLKNRENIFFGITCRTAPKKTSAVFIFQKVNLHTKKFPIALPV